MNRLPPAVLVLLVASQAIALAATPVVPVMPTSELRPGQHAIVRTVFAGDSIETFEADIVGVMSGGKADGEMILARATSQRVIDGGVAQGMSGSPVYINGRLIGALSSGWSFSKEPVFGITPIAEMLEVLDRPETASPEPTTGPMGSDPAASSAGWRGLSWSGDSGAEAAAPGPRAELSRPAALALPLAAGGLDSRAYGYARELFAPLGMTVTPGGRARPGAVERALEPGSAVAVDVLRGDLNFSAIGTVTYVDGDRVLIFGHPFFQSGEVRLPLSTAHIVGILPSLANSFKLGVPGTPVGTATQDRRPAVAGRLGRPPALMPFAVDVRQEGVDRHYHFETIEDRALMPQLVSAAAMNSVLESGGTGAQQTIQWTLTAWRGGRALKIRDATSGEAPLPELISGLAGPLRLLYNNPFSRFALDSARIQLDVQPGRREWSLRNAWLQAPAVRPGGRLRVRAELESWRGGRRFADLDVEVPRDLPGGHYVLWLGGGDELDRYLAMRLPSHFRPTSVEDAWQRLGALHASDALYAGLWARSPEISSAGEDFPELPSSAVALLAPVEAAGDGARRSEWALLREARAALPGVVRGELVLDLRVDPAAVRP